MYWNRTTCRNTVLHVVYQAWLWRTEFHWRRNTATEKVQVMHMETFHIRQVHMADKLEAKVLAELSTKLGFLCWGVRFSKHTHTQSHILLQGEEDCVHQHRTAESLEVTARHRAGVGLTTPASSLPLFLFHYHHSFSFSIPLSLI